MSSLLNVYVDNQAIGDHLFENPDAMIEVLSHIADRANDPNALRGFCATVAGEHSGSVCDQMVLPFLGLLAEELRQTEVAMGIHPENHA